MESKVKNGWKTQQEFSYWVPDCDIEGKIPADLHGTFIRNGPGLNEVYGKKLNHGLYFITSFLFEHFFHDCYSLLL